MRKDKTLRYYDDNAKKFVDGTLNLEFTEIQDKFLELLPDHSLILDFGCGSGRDTKYFMSKGHEVIATDGSYEIVKLASVNTGIEVKKMYFEDLDDVEKYDGVWACSSILHLDMDSLEDVMNKIMRSLKEGGIMYTSFKYGNFSDIRNGRFFTDMNEALLDDLLNSTKNQKIVEIWKTADVRPDRRDEFWLNIILRKVTADE